MSDRLVLAFISSCRVRAQPDAHGFPMFPPVPPSRDSPRWKGPPIGTGCGAQPGIGRCGPRRHIRCGRPERPFERKERPSLEGAVRSARPPALRRMPQSADRAERRILARRFLTDALGARPLMRHAAGAEPYTNF